MMDSIGDPFLNICQDGSMPESLLFTNDDHLGSIDLDLPLNSPNKLGNETLTEMTENPEFEAELNNFLANFSSPDVTQSTKTPSTIDLLDDFPFSPFDDESSKEKVTTTRPIDLNATSIVSSSTISTNKLPVIINTSKICHPHLPKVVQLTKGNVVYIQAPAKPAKSQTNFIQLSNCLPTILINTPISTAIPTPSLVNHSEDQPTSSSTTSIDDFPLDDIEYADIDHLPLTPSTSSESPDERTSTSPDLTHENSFLKTNRLHRSHPFHLSKSSTSMLTNLEKLPSSGPLLLTDEELKLIKQEGYQIPSKLPLTKTEEKILKKIRRKIKNKISAQESRRKKKEYVDTLERQIAKYIDENGALKERVSTMEKNQRSLMQELQSLRSMVGKGTPATGKVLMVLCLFFAVLFGIWSPIVNKQSSDGSNSQQKSVSSSSSSSSSAKNHDGSTTSRNTGASTKSLLDEQDLIKQEPTYNNYLPHNYKSRVLLSYDEHDQHYHGPYLPSNSKQQKSSFSYSNSVEKFMNKRFKTNSQTEENSDEKCNFSLQRSSACLKRPLTIESSSPSIILSSDSTTSKLLLQRSNHTSNYRINEKVVVIDQHHDKIDMNESSSTFEGPKPLKIIRVERTTPAIGNDTLKLSHRTANE